MTGDSSRWSWISFKAEAACSESQDIGALDLEALLLRARERNDRDSSRWSWISFKAEAARSESLFYGVVARAGT